MNLLWFINFKDINNSSIVKYVTLISNNIEFNKKSKNNFGRKYYKKVLNELSKKY